jgi:hypothetical protein
MRYYLIFIYGIVSTDAAQNLRARALKSAYKAGRRGGDSIAREHDLST